MCCPSFSERWSVEDHFDCLGAATDSRSESILRALHPDLLDSVVDHELDHPLLRWSFLNSPDDVRKVNELYASKRRQLGEAVVSKDWLSYVCLYERSHRLDALDEIIHDHKVELERLWPVVAHVWTDSENIWQREERWREIWSTRRNRRHEMSLDERDKLRKLPDKFQIWRGVNHEQALRGLSWTLDRNKACWFANRFAVQHGLQLLASGRVQKSDVLAYFADRSETEIVVFPECIYDVTSETIVAEKSPV